MGTLHFGLGSITILPKKVQVDPILSGLAAGLGVGALAEVTRRGLGLNKKGQGKKKYEMNIPHGTQQLFDW